MGSGPPDPLRETVTYGELTRNLGDGTTAQEVGAAVGRNPVCILIPCHRVVGAGGKLTGFAGGLGRKRFLLDTERDVARPLIPRRPVMTAGMLSQDPGVAGTHPLARNADDPHWQPQHSRNPAHSSNRHRLAHGVVGSHTQQRRRARTQLRK